MEIAVTSAKFNINLTDNMTANTFPFSSGVNGKRIQYHRQTSQSTVCRLRLRLKVWNQLIEPFHRSGLNGINEQHLQSHKHQAFNF